jgi:hypothetical protein
MNNGLFFLFPGEEEKKKKNQQRKQQPPKKTSHLARPVAASTPGPPRNLRGQSGTGPRDQRPGSAAVIGPNSQGQSRKDRGLRLRSAFQPPTPSPPPVTTSRLLAPHASARALPFALPATAVAASARSDLGVEGDRMGGGSRSGPGGDGGEEGNQVDLITPNKQQQRRGVYASHVMGIPGRGGGVRCFGGSGGMISALDLEDRRHRCTLVW